VEELDRRVARWVEAGAIRAEQGEAILALEVEGRGAGGRRRAVVAEVLGYLGGVLAVVAGFVLGAESWGQLGRWGRLGVLAAVTGALLAAGWWLRGSEGRVLPRLASVLWMFAVAGFAGLVAVLQEGRSDNALADPSLGVAAGALALAGVLYLLERRVLQQVALFLAVVATTVAGGHRLGWSWETVEGYGFLALGAAWLELGRRGLVGPRRTSEVLGSLALLTGPAVLDVEAVGPGDWGLWLGLGLSVALIIAGSALARNVLLGIGAAGMVLFLGMVAGEYWSDLGAPVAILLVGLGLVVAAVLVARLRPAGGGRPADL
jgi:Predicted membrane protein (DUF2157)